MQSHTQICKCNIKNIFIELPCFKCRMVWLLDDFYEVKHREFVMTEKRMVIKISFALVCFRFRIVAKVYDMF